MRVLAQNDDAMVDTKDVLYFKIERETIKTEVYYFLNAALNVTTKDIDPVVHLGQWKNKDTATNELYRITHCLQEIYNIKAKEDEIR
jgi:predicted transcriptional regulator